MPRALVSTLFGLWEERVPPPPSTPGRPRRKPTPQRGYAAPPGTGPEGETCGSCAHCRRAWDGRHAKCALMREGWTGGPKTDVLRKMAACKKWEA